MLILVILDSLITYIFDRKYMYSSDKEVLSDYTLDINTVLCIWFVTQPEINGLFWKENVNSDSQQCYFISTKRLIAWFIVLCLTLTLAVFQLYHGSTKQTKNTSHLKSLNKMTSLN